MAFDTTRLFRVLEGAGEIARVEGPAALAAGSGGVAGGTAGAAAGAVAGCVLGPPGAAVGFVVGFAVGTLGGARAGYGFAKWITHS